MKEKELNREERNKTVMETGALVMAEFYADWCPHCQKMMPIVKEFKELEKGKLEVVQINIEEERCSCRFVYDGRFLLLSCYGKGRLCGDNPAR